MADAQGPDIHGEKVEMSVAELKAALTHAASIKPVLEPEPEQLAPRWGVVAPEPEPEPEPAPAVERAPLIRHGGARSMEETWRHSDAVRTSRTGHEGDIEAPAQDPPPAAESLRIHGGMSGVEREIWKKIKDDAQGRHLVYEKARNAKAADLHWRAQKKAAERVRQLALKRAAHDAERNKGNVRVYRIAPRFEVDLAGARRDVARFEERVALAVVEEEAAEVELGRWKEELRTATAVTKDLHKKVAAMTEEATHHTEQRCGMTTTRPDRAATAFANRVETVLQLHHADPSWNMDGETHLEARIARAAAAHDVLVAWVAGQQQRNRDIDAEADALDLEVEQLRLNTKPIIDVIQTIDPRKRGNPLKMEALGAQVETLDLQAARKAAESLAARKSQAALWDELPHKKIEMAAAGEVIAGLQAERRVLMEAEAEMGEMITDWTRQAADYATTARAAVERMTLRKKAANREGRFAREALRKAQHIERELYEATSEFQGELAVRRAHYEETMAAQAAAAKATADEKFRVSEFKRKAAEVKANYEAECQAKSEAEQKQHIETRNAEMLAHEASLRFVKLGQYAKVVVTGGSYTGALATVLYIRDTFGKAHSKGSEEYEPGLRLAVGTSDSGILIWRTFDCAEPYVLAVNEEIRTKDPHGYVLAKNPALAGQYPQGGDKTRRLSNNAIRSRSVGAVRLGTDGWQSNTLSVRKGPPASAPGLHGGLCGRPGLVFYPVPPSADPEDEAIESQQKAMQERDATQTHVQQQLQRLGRDAISESIGLLQAPTPGVPSPLDVSVALEVSPPWLRNGERPASAVAVMVSPGTPGSPPPAAVPVHFSQRNSRPGTAGGLGLVGGGMGGRRGQQSRRSAASGGRRPKSAATSQLAAAVHPTMRSAGRLRGAYWM